MPSPKTIETARPARLSALSDRTWAQVTVGKSAAQVWRIETQDEVLFAKTAAGEIPPFVTVQTHQKVKDAISLLHEHRVSQLPVVSGTDVNTVVGSVGERGLLKRAIDNPGLMGAEIVDVMEPPFPAVSTTDPVREAVELLSGEGQALTVTEQGRPVGIVTRADLLESLAS